MTKKKFNPAQQIQDFQVFGEFGEVNPSISDASTFTFLSTAMMNKMFESEIEGCFLYARHFNPSNKYLSRALAAMEDTQSAHVTASGMAAIACTILQLCQSGDEIVSDRTIYGGTYAFFKNYLPRLGIKVKFVKISDHAMVARAVTKKTKLIYCESISNPLLSVADIPVLAEIARKKRVKLVVDNTFSPLILSPVRHGADIVVHSLTKYINGTSDCVAGAVCASDEFIKSLLDVNQGTCMLLGPALDSLRAASILKNMHSLHIRMQKHCQNAAFIAAGLKELGLKVYYPGFKNHLQHAVFERQKCPDYGFGGMVVLDVGTAQKASRVMEIMQNKKAGYLAVSLGFYKTLFSAPGSSTSSEIAAAEQKRIGISPGMIRMSVGIDQDINESFARMRASLKEARIL